MLQRMRIITLPTPQSTLDVKSKFQLQVPVPIVYTASTSNIYGIAKFNCR
jgi:hypothetical protein